MKKPLNKLKIVILFVCLATGAAAQVAFPPPIPPADLPEAIKKLPKVQQGNLRAPANVKIDGKPTEWGGKMQAYNRLTGLLYTIANDDKKLYLIIQSIDRQHAKLVEGITFAVQPTGKHTDKDAPLIKYPYISSKSKQITAFPLTPQTYSELKGVQIAKDPDGKKTEALIKESSKGLRALSKWIYTRGMLGKDSIISVYNEVGIEAANGFSTDKIYTSEVAIDLKLLGLSIDKPRTFAYHISVNGEPDKYRTTIADLNFSSNNMTQAQIDDFANANAAHSATLDFWGEYTLKK